MAVNLAFRRAGADDARLVFDWRNDPASCRNSISSKLLIWEEHKTWFERKMSDPNTFFYILMTKGKEPAGLVRIDVAEGKGQVSIVIAPALRGKGYGHAGLGLVINDASLKKVCGSFIAHVWEDNPASAQVFLKNGFMPAGDLTREGRRFLVLQRQNTLPAGIYVSSSCAGGTDIIEKVKRLAAQGYKNIELSGGSLFIPDLEDKLLSLRKEHDLNFLCHNYFPPPREPFVLNLASLDDGVYHRTLGFFREALRFSRVLGGSVFAVHAGFFIDIPVAEIGRQISPRDMYDQPRSVTRFCEGAVQLAGEAAPDALFIENNVISSDNLRAFEGRNPFMLTCFDEYQALKERLDFNLLLDLGHLKVSARSLGLDLDAQADRFWRHAEYIHVSDNDGISDQHKGFDPSSRLFGMLKDHGIKGKIVTLEIGHDEDGVRRAYGSLEGLL